VDLFADQQGGGIIGKPFVIRERVRGDRTSEIATIPDDDRFLQNQREVDLARGTDELERPPVFSDTRRERETSSRRSIGSSAREEIRDHRESAFWIRARTRRIMIDGFIIIL
jgi:hypothetical protein